MIQRGHASSLVILLLVALLSGVSGGAGALWAVANVAPARVALLGTPTPQPTATATPSSTATPTATPAPTGTATATAPPATPTETPSPTPTAVSTYSLMNLADLIDEVNSTVVTIFVIRGKTSTDKASTTDLISGSGVIIDPRGYLLTNYHVAQKAETLLVLYRGERLPALWVNGDEKADLALLKLLRPRTYEAIAWGDSDALRLGESVVAIGSPLGSLGNSVTVGVVSGLQRAVPLDDKSLIGGLIQTDAAVNNGNSGGPLLNMRGQLVGIVTLTLRSTSSDPARDIQGVAFAIPSLKAREFAEQWIAEANR